MNNLKLTGFQRKKNFKSNKTANIMKLINLLTKNGHKQISYKLLFETLSILKKESNYNAVEIFNIVLFKISPFVELKSIKLGSTKYLVPTPLSQSRQLLSAVSSLIKNSKLRHERISLGHKLAKEILDTYDKKSETYKQYLNFINLVNLNIQNSKFVKF